MASEMKGPSSEGKKNSAGANPTFTLSPLAYFRSSKTRPQEAARQACFDHTDTEAYLEFVPGFNFEQALRGLETCSHIWVIFQFHKNPNWKPVVTPPRGPRVGVLASRSPHRPNALGLSALEIQRIEGNRIYVKSHDLLEGSPIFDVKPYHPEADCIANAKLGWLESEPEFEIHWSLQALAQLEVLEAQGLRELRNFCEQQLAYEPLNSDKKRLCDRSESSAVLCSRTWRVSFVVAQKSVHIENIFSGYSAEELAASEDPYLDKALHRDFANQFPRHSKI